LRIHVIANIHRKDALRTAIDTCEWLRVAGHLVAFENETARGLSETGVPNAEFAQANLVVAFGGDGTLIRAASLCSPVGTPILGVYFGRFGFVTQCTAHDLRPAIEAFLNGSAQIESRMMVRAQLVRSGSVVTELHALNEVTVQRAVTSRMLTVKVSIDGHRLTSYPADGVLICTPTGSTAYNLSAGGPILDPTVQAIVLTAIAPHTLSSRALVIRPESEVSLRVTSDSESVMSVDALTRLHILSGDEVRVTQSPRVTNLVTVSDNDFLLKLGNRLFWSRGMVGEAL
jgi:NAD+ kinase